LEYDISMKRSHNENDKGAPLSEARKESSVLGGETYTTRSQRITASKRIARRGVSTRTGERRKGWLNFRAVVHQRGRRRETSST